MAAKKIIGYKRISYDRKKDGHHVEGLSLYLSEPIDNDGMGVQAENIYLSQQFLDGLTFKPEIGMLINVFYNRRGNIEAVNFVDKEIEIE